MLKIALVATGKICYSIYDKNLFSVCNMGESAGKCGVERRDVDNILLRARPGCRLEKMSPKRSDLKEM